MSMKFFSNNGTKCQIGLIRINVEQSASIMQ